MNKAPSQEEIREYMELHNADEVGIDDQWTLEDAEYHLLLSDKYHYANQDQEIFKCIVCGEKKTHAQASDSDVAKCNSCN